MGRYALCWQRRNEIGELVRQSRAITAAEARALIESKDDYVVAVAKLAAKKLEGEKP